MHECGKCNDCCTCALKGLPSPEQAFHQERPAELTSKLVGMYLLEEIVTRIENNMGTTATAAFRIDEGIANDLKGRAAAQSSALCEELANMYYDYIAHTAFGEARYGACTRREKPGQLSLWRYTMDIGGNKLERKLAYVYAIEHNPKQFLPVLRDFFRLPGWKGKVGGKPWGRIAEAGANRRKWSTRVWLDHVVDMSHHNGLYLNKPKRFDFAQSSYYKSILNWKTYGKLSTPEYVVPIPIEPLAYALCLEAARLNLISFNRDYFDRRCSGTYVPLPWGNTPVHIVWPATLPLSRAKVRGGSFVLDTGEDINQWYKALMQQRKAQRTALRKGLYVQEKQVQEAYTPVALAA